MRFGKESKTDWEQVRWTFAKGWCLREMREETLLECLRCDEERLLWIVEESPRMVGPVQWSQAVMVVWAYGAVLSRTAEAARDAAGVGVGAEGVSAVRELGG